MDSILTWSLLGVKMVAFVAIAAVVAAIARSALYEDERWLQFAPRPAISLVRSVFGRHLRVDHITIPITGLDPRLQGTKIVQLTDLHEGQRMDVGILQDALRKAAAQNPDLVVLTGDYIDYEPSPVIYNLSERLRTNLVEQVTCPVLAVLGNHDIAKRGARATVTSVLESVGIDVLWNETRWIKLRSKDPLSTTVPPLEGSSAAADLHAPEPEHEETIPFPVVGFADRWSQELTFPVIDRILGSLPKDQARLVLEHNPDAADDFRHYRVDLQLSGHTHGGMFQVPYFEQPVGGHLRRLLNSGSFGSWLRRFRVLHGLAKAVRHWEWASGLSSIKREAPEPSKRFLPSESTHNWLYTSRGLANAEAGPARMWSSPEVTVIYLVAA